MSEHVSMLGGGGGGIPVGVPYALLNIYSIIVILHLLYHLHSFLFLLFYC